MKRPPSVINTESEPEAPSTVLKTTVKLSSDSVRDAKELAASRGTSVAEVIRRAIWIEKYLHDQIKAGSKVQVVDSEKNIKELVLR